MRLKASAALTVILLALSMSTVPTLAQEEQASAEPETSIGADAATVELPVVEGIEWWREWEGYGATASASDIAPLAIDVFVEAVDADIAQFGGHGADAHDSASGERVGAYLGMRVSGADTERIEQATLTWLASLLGLPEAPVSDKSIGEVDVLSVSVDGMGPLFVLTAGDTVHLISTPEDVAARILAALP